MDDRSDEAVEVHPATPGRWDDVVRLAGPNGFDMGCWCMWWRTPNAELARRRDGEAQAGLQRLVDDDQQPGLIAYRAGEPAGWAAWRPVRRTGGSPDPEAPAGRRRPGGVVGALPVRRRAAPPVRRRRGAAGGGGRPRSRPRCAGPGGLSRRQRRRTATGGQDVDRSAVAVRASRLRGGRPARWPAHCPPAAGAASGGTHHLTHPAAAAASRGRGCPPSGSARGGTCVLGVLGVLGALGALGALRRRDRHLLSQ